jgi:hypothetical protein
MDHSKFRLKGKTICKLPPQGTATGNLTVYSKSSTHVYPLYGSAPQSNNLKVLENYGLGRSVFFVLDFI